jgi:Ca2+:H+ antiporter
MASPHHDISCTNSALNGDVEEQSPLLPSSDPCRRELRVLLRMFTPGSYSNLLLVFIPLGTTFGLQNRTPELIFWFNLVAIIPLSKLNVRKLRRLSCMLGPLSGGFLHAILDNAPLLIVRTEPEIQTSGSEFGRCSPAAR